MLTIPDNLGATGAILVGAISTISGRQIPGKLIDHCSKYRQTRMRNEDAGEHILTAFSEFRTKVPTLKIGMLAFITSNFLFGLIARFDVLSVF